MNGMPEARAGVVYAPEANAYLLYLSFMFSDGRRRYARPVEFAEIPEGYRYEPFLEIPPEVAQMLLDELWRAGLRPNNGEGTSAQVDALKAHIADLQRLNSALLSKLT